MRRADDGTDGRETDLPGHVGAPLVDELRDVVPHRTSVLQDDVLEVAARVRRADEHEDPDAAAAHGAEKRLDGVPAEPGVDGERVRTRRIALDVRLYVRPRGRADVAPFAVCDHKEAGASRVDADLLEGGDPGGAERLEEGELRLHGDRVRRDGVDDSAAEARHVAAELDRQQIDPRIEADDELRALALDLRSEAIGEG